MIKYMFNPNVERHTPCSHVIQQTCIEYYMALPKHIPFLHMLKNKKKWGRERGMQQAVYLITCEALEHLGLWLP